MKKKLLIGAALILSVGMACTSGAGDWQSYSGDKRIEERVDSVLALMTLEEKIGQMTQYSAKSDIVTGPQVNIAASVTLAPLGCTTNSAGRSSASASSQALARVVRPCPS